MRNFSIILMLSFGLSLAVVAQPKATIIKRVNGKVVDVEIVDREAPYAFNPFSETDSDGDGKIDWAEARNAGILNFALADRNSDGWIDEIEYDVAAFDTRQAPPSQ